MFTDTQLKDAARILDHCRKKGLKLATAESCTGGLLSGLFTEIPGSSDVFECGFLTYSNISKTEMLGVDPLLIKNHGSVSAEVASAMAQGAYTKAKVDVSIAITGIAGPTGATKDKPIGLVYIAIAAHDSIIVENHHFKGNRTQVRLQAVERSLFLLDDRLSRSFVYVA